ncbi:MAG: exosortase H [Chloroflexi bacterium]|nr:exosortase H [Chloroflexota bacterium]
MLNYLPPIKSRDAFTGFALLLSLGTALALYYALLDTSLLNGVNRWTASTSGWALQGLGSGVTVNGTVVGSQDFAYRVVAECTAIGPAVLFVAAIAAYPASLRAKLIGLFGGLAAITALNLVRMISLFYIGAYFPQYLDMAHLLIWQGVMILSVVILWLFWAQRWGQARQP